ncbi:MAG: glycosyltransferase family 2 protein [Ginsengibacter sp.]
MYKGISVIIPVYNRKDSILKAIQSVLQQKVDAKVEVVVSDDGSNDGTLSRLEVLGDKIRLLKKPDHCNSQGASGARNRGVLAARMPLICFLDSDDIFLPGHLQSIKSVLDNDATIGFAFCRLLEMKEINGSEWFRPWTHRYIFKNDIKNIAVSRTRIVHTNSFIFKREVFDKVGLFNESYSNGEDTDLWMRISEKFQGKFSDHYGAVYRMEHNMGQLTKNTSDRIVKCYKEVYSAAINRYYNLGLKDSSRIFKLKHWIITLDYRSNRKKYYSQLLKLVIKYPFVFLRRLPIIYSEFFEKPESQIWHPLNHFTRQKLV